MSHATAARQQSAAQAESEFGIKKRVREFLVADFGSLEQLLSPGLVAADKRDLSFDCIESTLKATPFFQRDISTHLVDELLGDLPVTKVDFQSRPHDIEEALYARRPHLATNLDHLTAFALRPVEVTHHLPQEHQPRELNPRHGVDP